MLIFTPLKLSLPFQFSPFLSLLLHSSVHISSIAITISRHCSSSQSQNPQSHHRLNPKKQQKFDPSIEIDLILAYHVRGEIYTARYLLEILFRNNTQLLNSRIRELSFAGFFGKVLDLYRFLRICNVKPDNSTFIHSLKACASLIARLEGDLIHSHIVRYGCRSDYFVVNSLIDMYCKFGLLQSARQLFDEMPERNQVSWNSMISGYRLNGFPDLALEICSLRKFEGMRIDRVGLKIVLPLCGQLGALQLGKSAHSYAINLGLSSDLDLITAIMDMYVKCGEIDLAERIFDKILYKDVITWNTMISGYSKIGKPEMVLKLFRKMQVESLLPTVVTALITIRSCADLTVLCMGEMIHGYIIKIGICLDASVETLLIDMYSKCGKLDLACRVFNGICRGNVNTWSTLISALGKHGYGRNALMVFFKMLQRGIDPDGVSVLLVLSACGHAGLVNEGRGFFNYVIKQFEITPEMEHYVSMVHLLGRAGFLEEAFRFICQMPIEPDMSVWGAFSGSCRIHRDFKMAKAFKEKVFDQSCPRTAGYYMILLDLYAGRGDWEEVIRIRNLMEERAVKKTTGCSLIEIKN